MLTVGGNLYPCMMRSATVRYMIASSYRYRCTLVRCASSSNSRVSDVDVCGDDVWLCGYDYVREGLRGSECAGLIACGQTLNRSVKYLEKYITILI